MRKTILALTFFSFSFSLSAQRLDRPRLVVGIVIDQMRYDYLYRFYDRFSNGGFKRLLREGFSCETTFIPYTPTHTAAGHTCVYTGSVPALHGIMGNSWYDKSLGRDVYCTEDNTVKTVGSNSNAGKMSPRNLWSNTITDELRLASNFKNKTIAIALKDRGAILPGGHTSNGSFWFDNASGGWITSTFYMPELPGWVKKINDKKLPDAYLKKGWNTLYPLNTYTKSTSDSNAYEGRMPGEDIMFPHRTDTITKNRYDAFKTSPYGSTYTFDMARAAVEGEELGGVRGLTDFLAISCSSPDYIGHTFGPNSVEIEDAYLRLDLDLADFLRYLDGRVGRGNYLVFLTADHAVAHNPAFLQDHKLPSGVFDHNEVRRQMNDTLLKRYKTGGIVARSSNYQLFLNDSIINTAGLDKEEIKTFLTGYFITNPAVANVVDLENLSNINLPSRLKMMLTNGYNQKLSGDLQFVLKPQWFQSWLTGSTHSQWHPYDSHIPLLWYGWHVRPGKTGREVYMTDIAATLANMLHIQMPNASIGHVIEEVANPEPR
jgi:predicted AlkP superfamily pyrophosphatase or phosphodiesterase